MNELELKIIENGEAALPIEDYTEPPEDIEASNAEESAESETKAEAEDTEADIPALQEQIKALQGEIARLEQEKQSQERSLREISEFTELFPHIDPRALPDSVWESVKQGVPLAASYAVYEKRLQLEQERIAKINSGNASRSPGKVGTNTASEYFTPDEVRKMSPAEVHANYSKIKASMKKWL